MTHSFTDARKHALIVFNPAAGSASAQILEEMVERHFTSSDWTYEIHETVPDENTADIIRQSLKRQNFSLVVAAGGDGTVSNVADALLRSEVPVGIVPIGTTNTLARELGVPLDAAAASQLLTGEHDLICLDGMQVGEETFLLHISIDLVALAIERTEREAKRRFGPAAYLWTAVTQWLGYQPCRFMLSVDGQPPRQVRAASVFITNIGTIGITPFRWGPHIRPDDGQLDICIVKARTFFDYLRVIWFALLGQQLRNPHIKYLTAECIVGVRANRPLPVQGDGEIIGQTAVEVKFVPRAIQLVVPPAPEKNSSTGF